MSVRSIETFHVAIGSVHDKYAGPRSSISATSRWNRPSVPMSPPSAQNQCFMVVVAACNT
jgi:hypothetical protein